MEIIISFTSCYIIAQLDEDVITIISNLLKKVGVIHMAILVSCISLL